MGTQDDPGYDRVTDRTREFELEDEQVFSGAGRGPTPEEREAAERYVSGRRRPVSHIGKWCTEVHTSSARDESSTEQSG